jgi:hypothetical protein
MIVRGNNQQYNGAEYGMKEASRRMTAGLFRETEIITRHGGAEMPLFASQE